MVEFSIHLGILLVFFSHDRNVKKKEKRTKKRLGTENWHWSPGSTLELHIIYLNDTPACGHFFGFSFMVMRSRDRDTGMRGEDCGGGRVRV